MKPGKPLKRSELIRKTQLVAHTPMPRSSTPLRRGAPIAQVSAKRRREQRTYTQQRREFLADRPRCEFPSGCREQATEVHHRMGRVGALYLDQTHWSALCHDHHAWITTHPQAAYDMGISERRNAA